MPLTIPQTDTRLLELRNWQGSASSPVFDNMDRGFEYTNGLAALTTQVMASFAIFLPAGAVISNLTFRSGATGAGTPTNWWFALYDTAATPNLIVQTADQTTTAWAANTTMDLALTAAQTLSVSGVYWASVMMKATTPINLLGSIVSQAAASAGLVAGQKAKAQTSGSALTTTAPATIATPTAIVGIAGVSAH